MKMKFNCPNVLSMLFENYIEEEFVKKIKCYTFQNAASYDFPVVRVSDIKYFFQIFTFSSSYLSLRVFRVRTWLTVDRALYIPKHSGGAKGCLCQRLLVLWTNKQKFVKIRNRKLNFPNVLIKFKNV